MVEYKVIEDKSEEGLRTCAKIAYPAYLDITKKTGKYTKEELDRLKNYALRESHLDIDKFLLGTCKPLSINLLRISNNLNCEIFEENVVRKYWFGGDDYSHNSFKFKEYLALFYKGLNDLQEILEMLNLCSIHLATVKKLEDNKALVELQKYSLDGANLILERAEREVFTDFEPNIEEGSKCFIHYDYIVGLPKFDEGKKVERIKERNLADLNKFKEYLRESPKD